nr:MAG TPA: hypothetical protein [Caudoviricetes sp.]DAW60125.1 MAG TPA: hypothetical protein [Caudoviricetes sp.]
MPRSCWEHFRGVQRYVIPDTTIPSAILIISPAGGK